MDETGASAFGSEVSKVSVPRASGSDKAGGTEGSIGANSVPSGGVAVGAPVKSVGIRTIGPEGVVAAGFCGGAGALGPGAVTAAGSAEGEAGTLTGAGSVRPGGSAVAAPSNVAVSFGGEIAGSSGAATTGTAPDSASGKSGAGSDETSGTGSSAGPPGVGPKTRMGRVSVPPSGFETSGADGDVVTIGGSAGTRSDDRGRSARLDVAGCSRGFCCPPTPTRTVISPATTVPAMIGVSTGVGRNFGPIADIAANNTAIMNRPSAKLTSKAALIRMPPLSTRNARQRITLTKSATAMIVARINLFRRRYNQTKAQLLIRTVPRRNRAIPWL